MPRHPQVRERKQHEYLCRVLRQALESNLGVAKLPLDYPERMFHLRPHLRLASLKPITCRCIVRKPSSNVTASSCHAPP
jgi:hypothetical protein